MKFEGLERYVDHEEKIKLFSDGMGNVKAEILHAREEYGKAVARSIFECLIEKTKAVNASGYDGLGVQDLTEIAKAYGVELVGISDKLGGGAMTNDELKKKIVKVLKETINWQTDYSIPVGIVYKSELDKIADALILAGIGDLEYERFVFKKAYMDFFTRFNRDKEFHKNFDSVTLGCQIGKFEDMMEKAKKELAEERKDD